MLLLLTWNNVFNFYRFYFLEDKKYGLHKKNLTNNKKTELRGAGQQSECVCLESGLLQQKQTRTDNPMRPCVADGHTTKTHTQTHTGLYSGTDPSLFGSINLVGTALRATGVWSHGNGFIWFTRWLILHPFPAFAVMCHSPACNARDTLYSIKGRLWSWSLGVTECVSWYVTKRAAHFPRDRQTSQVFDLLGLELAQISIDSCMRHDKWQFRAVKFPIVPFT